MKKPGLWEGPEEETVESDHGIAGLRRTPLAIPFHSSQKRRILPRHELLADFLLHFLTWVRVLFLHSMHCLSVCLGLNTASLNTANLSSKFIVPETSEVR